MNAFWAGLVVFVGFGLVLAGLAWLGSFVRRRRIGGAVMGPFEEIWFPSARTSRSEMQVQEIRLAPQDLKNGGTPPPRTP